MPSDPAEWDDAWRLAAADGSTILAAFHPQENAVNVRIADARAIAAAPRMVALLQRFSGCTCCGHRAAAEDAAALLRELGELP